jgi:hypothetical protein
MLIDGARSALHTGATTAVVAQVAHALAAKLPGTDPDELLPLVQETEPSLPGHHSESALRVFTSRRATSAATPAK